MALTSLCERPSSRRPSPSCGLYAGNAASTTVTPSSSATRYQLTIDVPIRTTLSLIRSTPQSYQREAISHLEKRSDDAGSSSLRRRCGPRGLCELAQDVRDVTMNRV